MKTLAALLLATLPLTVHAQEKQALPKLHVNCIVDGKIQQLDADFVHVQAGYLSAGEITGQRPDGTLEAKMVGLFPQATCTVSAVPLTAVKPSEGSVKKDGQ